MCHIILTYVPSVSWLHLIKQCTITSLSFSSKWERKNEPKNPVEPECIYSYVHIIPSIFYFAWMNYPTLTGTYICICVHVSTKICVQLYVCKYVCKHKNIKWEITVHILVGSYMYNYVNTHKYVHSGIRLQYSPHQSL